MNFKCDIMNCVCGGKKINVNFGRYDYSNYYCKITCKECGMMAENVQEIYNSTQDWVISGAVGKWNNIQKRLRQVLEKKTMHLIDILVGMESDIPCDYMTLLVDENGECWCEKNCKDKDCPTKECWLRYLEVKEEM